MLDYIHIQNHQDKILTTVIDDIKSIINPTYKRVARGQSDCNWKLDCSYFRNTTQKYETCKNLFGKSWTDDDESAIKTTFPLCMDNGSLQAFPHLGLLIQIQQNYKNPTPLLDVSTDIYMPLFCACGEGKENLNKDGKIFIIEIDDHCYVGGCKNTPIDTESRILSNAIIPTFNDRMKKQNGAMIRTMDVINGDLSFCDISTSGNTKITEYIIPAENKLKILNNLKYELKTTNLNYYFYGNN